MRGAFFRDRFENLRQLHGSYLLKYMFTAKIYSRPRVVDSCCSYWHHAKLTYYDGIYGCCKIIDCWLAAMVKLEGC